MATVVANHHGMYSVRVLLHMQCSFVNLPHCIGLHTVYFSHSIAECIIVISIATSCVCVASYRVISLLYLV